MAFTNGQLWRVRVIFIGVAVLFCLLVSRLYSIQVDNHKKYLHKAIDQQWARIPEKSWRGSILDRHGRVLAQSKMAKSVYVDTVKVRDVEALSNVLAYLLDVSQERIYKRMTAKRGKFIVIKRKVSEEERQAVEALGLSCIYFQDEPKRFYPQGDIASQVIGLVDVDDKGIGGVELMLNKPLSGKDGVRIMQRDGKGQLSAKDEFYYPPSNGLNIELTIDSIAQERLEKHLRDACEKWTPKWGGAVVMDVKTGEILAMASYPTFDPNNVGDYSVDSRRLKVVTDGLPPGSTWKAFTYAFALENNVITPETDFSAHDGSWRYRSRTIRDCGRYGRLSAEFAVVKSSNIIMAQIGLMMGGDMLRNAVDKFGFIEKTGIQFPGEFAGYVTPARRWSYFSTTSVAFGQEMRVSVLQMAAAYSAIANGGLLMKPILVKRVVDENGKVLIENKPKAVRRVISAKTAALVRRALRFVVTRGTARRSNIPEYAILGKTGTAQMENQRGGPDHTKYAGWFAGCAPADDPRICVMTVLVEPVGKYYGGTVAAPTVTAIIKDVLPLMKVPPKNEVY